MMKAEISKFISQVFSSGLIYIVYQQGGKLIFLLLPDVFK